MIDEELCAEITDRAKAGTLLDAIFNKYGLRSLRNDDSIVIALAHLHNKGSIDLLRIVSPSSIVQYTGPCFFQGQNVYRALIGRLNASAAEILTTLQTLTKAGGRDLAAGLPVNEFAEWCALDPARPMELLALIDAKFPDSDRFITIAIKHGVSVDRVYFLERAYQFLRAGTEVEKLGAINALGQIPLCDDDWAQWLTAFTELLGTSPSDQVNAAVLGAVVRRLDDPETGRQSALENIAALVIGTLGDHVLHATAQALASGAAIPNRMLENMLHALRAVKAEHTGTIDILDFALMRLIELGRISEARTLVEHLIRRKDAVKAERFDSCWYKLRSLDEDVLSDWVVAWLLDGDYQLGFALSDALFSPSLDSAQLTIDFHRFALRPIDYPYIARKAISTFFIQPRLMASVVVALLRAAPTEEADAIVNLLVDPILINYPSLVDGFIRPLLDEGPHPAARRLTRALEQFQAYLDPLESIRRVPELHPSERERTIERQRRDDRMLEAQRQARSKSVLASLVSESVLLYGTRCISWVSDPATAPRRLETALHSISHSLEFPRGEFLDPIGLHMMMTAFRAEERSK
jgi:hypothetical protein